MSIAPAVDDDEVDLILSSYLRTLPLCQHRVISLQPINVGLINSTWKVLLDNHPTFLLQRINTNVFKSPETIDSNIRYLQNYAIDRMKNGLKKPFPFLLTFQNGESLLQIDNKTCYRVFEYVPNCKSISAPSTPELAYEAARIFGYFFAFFQDLDVSKLQYTIPDFHNLPLKYKAFEYSRQYGIPERIAHAERLIDQVYLYKDIVDKYEEMQKVGALPTRVIHHDAKIANMLFNEDDGKGE
jgi:hypothetical protein